jgi:hypothetical protein
LLPHIRERFSSHEFESLSHLAQRLAYVDVRAPVQTRTTFQKRLNFAGDSSDSENEAEIGLAEWTKNREPVLCPFAKKQKEKYGFNITKADQIFDLLLQEGQIKLYANHTIPSATKLKNLKYCKWHNAVSHSTNKCIVFCKEIQSAIEAGRIKFGTPKKPMKIDGHPFPTYMVEVSDHGAKTGLKLLTSE